MNVRTWLLVGIILSGIWSAECVYAGNVKKKQFTFKAAGEKTYYFNKYKKVEDCTVSAEVSLNTDSDDFGEIRLVVRDSGEEKIIGGVILSKKIIWAQARDYTGRKSGYHSTNSNYIRHSKTLDKQKIIITVKGENVTMKIANKTYEYYTEVEAPGKIGVIVKANARGKCTIENIKVVIHDRQNSI